MTETHVEAPENNADNLPQIDLSNHEDQTIARLWEKVIEEEPGMWETYEKISKSAPPTTAEIEKIASESEDSEVVALKKAAEKAAKAAQTAREKLHDYIKSGFDSLPDEEIESLKTDFRGHVARIKAVHNLITDVAQKLSVDGVADEIKRYHFPTLRGMGVGNVTGTSHTGPRPQVKAIRVTKPGKDTKTYDKVSFAAQYAGVETGEMLNLWLTAAGADKWQDVKGTVSFEANGAQVEVDAK